VCARAREVTRVTDLLQQFEPLISDYIGLHRTWEVCLDISKGNKCDVDLSELRVLRAHSDEMPQLRYPLGVHEGIVHPPAALDGVQWTVRDGVVYPRSAAHLLDGQLDVRPSDDARTRHTVSICARVDLPCDACETKQGIAMQIQVNFGPGPDPWIHKTEWQGPIGTHVSGYVHMPGYVWQNMRGNYPRGSIEFVDPVNWAHIQPAQDGPTIVVHRCVAQSLAAFISRIEPFEPLEDQCAYMYNPHKPCRGRWPWGQEHPRFASLCAHLAALDCCDLSCQTTCFEDGRICQFNPNCDGYGSPHFHANIPRLHKVTKREMTSATFEESSYVTRIQGHTPWGYAPYGIVMFWQLPRDDTVRGFLRQPLLHNEAKTPFIRSRPPPRPRPRDNPLCDSRLVWSSVRLYHAAVQLYCWGWHATNGYTTPPTQCGLAIAAPDAKETAVALASVRRSTVCVEFNEPGWERPDKVPMVLAAFEQITSALRANLVFNVAWRFEDMFGEGKGRLQCVWTLYDCAGDIATIYGAFGTPEVVTFTVLDECNNIETSAEVPAWRLGHCAWQTFVDKMRDQCIEDISTYVREHPDMF
jgi:hypothetical protein